MVSLLHFKRSRSGNDGECRVWKGTTKYFTLLFCLAVFSWGISGAQTKTVQGTVYSSDQQPFPGVTVRVKGTSSGASTDAGGQFILRDVPPDAVLVFTAIGFLTKEEPVNGRTEVNVTLQEDQTRLNEVVVTGYGGTVKKRDLTGAISSVTAKDIEERHPINLFDALQGQAAGVLVVNDGGGAPGATGSIQIRGASTLNGGNGPLYVVDGVIDDNGALINPKDIASVEVLKDAASASIYGARAANGVILITTKQGKEGQPRLNVGYAHTFGWLAHKIPQNNSAEVRAFRTIQGRGNNADSLNPSFNADYDLQDLLLGNTAQKDELRLSVSGGKNGLTYYTGLNYLNDRSIITNSWLKRIQARVNVEYQITSKLKYSNNISVLWDKGNYIPLGRTINVALDRPAYSLIYYPDGSLTSYIGSKRNPIANALYEMDNRENISAQFNNQLDYDIVKGLRFTALFNGKLRNYQQTYLSPRFISSKKDQNNGRDEMSKTFSWEFQTFLNYNKTLAGDHQINAMFGFSADKNRFDRFHLQYKNSVNEEIYVALPDYLDIPNTYTDATANATASLFGRLGYNYKGKYIVQGTFRRDGSSRFGADSRWGDFFSGSAAWRFSDEHFMAWAGHFLNDAKLRLSIGQLGNDQIGDYESFTKVVFGGNYGGVGGAALSSTFGNSHIQWEMTTQKNIGIDLSFFNGRLGFTSDYYIKTTRDLLYGRDLPKETGYDKVEVNVGSIETKGLEFVVNAIPVTTRDFSWSIGGNITFERGRILSLANHTPFITGNKWYIEEGGRIGSFYGWTNLGVYQWDESNAYNGDWDQLTVVLGKDGKPLYDDNGKAVYTFDGKPYTGTVHHLYAPDGMLKGGDAKWLNLNKDSLIDDADRHVIGNATPDFYLGLINTVTYKQFSLTFLFNASFGGQIYNTLKYNASYPSNTGAGYPDMVYHSWTKPGDKAIYPYYIERNSRGNLKKNQNSLWLEDGSFIRLSSARLVYTLNPGTAGKLFMKGADLYIYGSNLLTWTNYTGFDPEFSSSNPLTPGDDTGKYPKRREVGFGLDLNF